MQTVKEVVLMKKSTGIKLAILSGSILAGVLLGIWLSAALVNLF